MLYRMHDEEPNGVFGVKSEHEAKYWNNLGHGIFWTVNEFNGPRRIENLKSLTRWAVDIDSGTKPTQWERIRDGLIPSLVVETKRGFQAYWNANGAVSEHWNSIVLDRLVPFYGADRNARDIARILRVPGYFHLKNPFEPFLVRKVFERNTAYTEAQIAHFYPLPRKVTEDRKVHNGAKKEFSASDGFWERVFRIDCRDALEKLSGDGVVSGERFSFRRTAKGSWNICVDKKGTSCWVDKDGRIGSLDRGGPTVYQWLRWYGNSPKDCVEKIKSLYPGIEEGG